MIESVTVRYEGSVRGLRALRRRLERSGLQTGFETYGIDGGTTSRPGTGLWFQMTVSGPQCVPECRAIASTWSEGSFMIAGDVRC